MSNHSPFGPVETVPLSKRQMLGGAILIRNSQSIPHVTHHDDIDITVAETRRREWNSEHGEGSVTLLPVLVSALVGVLATYPKFNASLDPTGEHLIVKQYYNIGVAVDTNDGLLVPVIRSCDTKSIRDIAREIGAMAAKARDRGLSIAEMSGGCFTVTSLGHIGGTGFTPIINAPEVGILGVCRSRSQLVQAPDGHLSNRTVLPVSLSYDHRAINGVDAARFTRSLEDAICSNAFLERSFPK